MQLCEYVYHEQLLEVFLRANHIGLPSVGHFIIATYMTYMLPHMYVGHAR